MGFFQDLKEDLSQAVSEFTGDELIGDELIRDEIEKEEVEIDIAEAESKDLFAAAEESMGITYDGDVDAASVEAALTSFIDQVAANAEIAQERYDSAMNNKLESRYESPVNSYESRYETENSYGNYVAPENSYTYGELIKEEEPEEEIPEVQISDEVAVITKNMVVNGDLVSIGSLDVMGVVNGNIKVNGELNVSGEINGSSEASNIIMTNSTVTGDVISSGAVKIGSKSVVRGNVFATSAVISGAIKGDIDVHGPVILDSTAIVMGNIKSKAVQINNGAAIEGMCSQCYAEVSPSAFFRD